MKTAIQSPNSVSDIVEQAKLGWGVKLEQATYTNSLGQPADIPGKFAVVRTDIDHPLGVVGRRYSLINNAESLSILDGLMDGGGQVLDAGFYGEGQTVFVNLDLGQFTIRGDTLHRRMNLRTAHDGSCSLKCSMSTYRQICSNGMYGWGKDESVTIRHTTNWKSAMAEARHVLGIAERYHIWFQQQLYDLTTRPCDPAQARVLAYKWFNEDTTKGQNSIADVVRLYQFGKGNHGRTMYDLYNGLTEYVDHHKGRGRKSETREISNTQGAGKKLKVTALKDILQYV